MVHATHRVAALTNEVEEAIIAQSASRATPADIVYGLNQGQEEDLIRKTSDRVFQKKRHRVTTKGHIQGRFDSEELQRAMKEIVIKQGLHENILLEDASDDACKV